MPKYQVTIDRTTTMRYYVEVEAPSEEAAWGLDSLELVADAELKGDEGQDEGGDTDIVDVNLIEE